MRAFLLMVCGGVTLAAGAFAADPEAGRVLAGQCRTCHGLDGIARIPVAPNIAGEPEAWLAAQLTAFRDGAREHEMMTVVSRSLTDPAIADLAVFYSTRQTVAALPPGVSPEGAPALCVGCHGADGIAVIEDVPNLAGENTIYIETQIKAYRTGQRVNEVMQAIASDISDADLRAAATWYGNVTLTRVP